MLRRQVAAILRARSRALSAEGARDMAVVLLQLMKAASSLSDEEGLPGKAQGLAEIQELAVQFVEQRLRTPAN
jgi:hypothetical protein